MIISLVAGAFGDLIFLPALLATFPNLLLSKKKFSVSAGSTLVFILLVSQNTYSAEKKLSVDQILDKSKKLISSQDDSAEIIMKIIRLDNILSS